MMGSQQLFWALLILVIPPILLIRATSGCVGPVRALTIWGAQLSKGDERVTEWNVDVSTEIVIRRGRQQVAEWSADPTRASLWHPNIKRVEWLTEPPLTVGSRVRFTAEVLRRQIQFTCEIVEHVPGERLVMRTSEAPFPMETTYEWSDAGPGGTLMRLRNRGRASGFGYLLAPILGVMVRRANRRDLRRLKAILELRR